MSRYNWKAIERSAAALFGLLRHPANSGGRLDFGGKQEPFVGQVKNPKSLSLAQLTELASEMEGMSRPDQLGVVVVKLSARRPTPQLIVMTEHEWLKITKLHLGVYAIDVEEKRKTLEPRKPGYYNV